MNTPKITKKNYFENIVAMLNGEDVEIPVEDMVAFCEKEIAALDKRADTARARAAAKREAGDELQNLVYSLLTDEPATRQDMFDRVIDEVGEEAGYSLAKVGYRLTALTSAGKAVKSEVVVTGEDGKSKKLAAYALA